jgi:hypothetical protein
MECLTLLLDYNAWLDWEMEVCDLDNEDEDSYAKRTEPKKFPCYIGTEIVGWEDGPNGEENVGQPLFAPVFFYEEDLKKMLEELK